MTLSFQVLGVDHLVLRVRDITCMLDFYENTLGCKLERYVEHVGLWQLRAGSALIDLVNLEGELGQRLSSELELSKGNMDHFCLQIAADSLESVTESLASQGVVVSDIKRHYGAQGFGPSIYLDDPEGNTVELKLHLQQTD